MQGFLLHTTTPNSAVALKRVLPFTSLQKVYSREIHSDINLYTWGEDPGDIHLSYRQGNSFLILNGYISESSTLGSFSNQQEACDLLRIFFDNNCPSKSPSNLLHSLYGSFSFIYIIFKETGTIWTFSDRIASRPLWYKKEKDELQISSHALAIAKSSHNCRYSPSGLASYLLYSTQIEPTNSLFSNIQCLQEGTVSSHSLTKTDSTRNWYKFKHTPDYSHSIKSWVELTSRYFIKAAERLCKTTNSPLLFLSGGLDSRLAAAALFAADIKPQLCTLGDSHNLEISIAEKVAKSFDCKQLIILRDDEWYLRNFSQKIFSTNGTYSWIHSHFREAYNAQLKKQTVDSAILGDFCEAFSKLFLNIPNGLNHLGTSKQFLSRFDTLPLSNYQPNNRERTLSLFQQDYRKIAEKALDLAIRQRYEQARNISVDPLVVGDYFFRWQTATCLPTFQMLNDLRSVGPERNLMYDNELHSLLEIMPSSIRSKHNLGARVVNKLYPPAAKVPNANSLLPLVYPLPLHSLAKKMRPMLGKVRRKLFTNTYHTTASWPHLPLLYANNKTWKHKIEENLFHTKSQLPSEIFDHNQIDKCWSDFCQGDLTLHADIERLLGLAELNNLL